MNATAMDTSTPGNNDNENKEDILSLPPLFRLNLYDNNMGPFKIIPPKPENLLFTTAFPAISHIDKHDEYSHYSNTPEEVSYHNLFSTLTTTTQDVVTTIRVENNKTTPQPDTSAVAEQKRQQQRQQQQQHQQQRRNSTGSVSSSTSSQPQLRDPNNGAFTFKPNTELDLLSHVQNGLDYGCSNYSTLDEVEASNIILRMIDGYCYGKQWMFHIGQEKGVTIKNYLYKAITAFLSSKQNRPFTVVELGTYCGYSAILLAKAIRVYMIVHNLKEENFQFHIYSTELSPQLVQIAKSMIKLSKLSKYITVVLMDPDEQKLSTVLKKQIPNRTSSPTPQIDFLFLDHAKDMYLKDLTELEKNAFIRTNTHVAADNVVYNSEMLSSYRKHVQALAKKVISVKQKREEEKQQESSSSSSSSDNKNTTDFAGPYVKTTLIEETLEYSDEKDGIELTTYLKDPFTLYQ